MKKKLSYLLIVILILSMFPMSAFAADPAEEAVTSISVGDVPTALDFDNSTNTLWVVNSNDSSVSVIDLSTRKVIDTLSVGSNPHDIAIGSKYAYVICKDQDYVYVYDLETREEAGAIQVQRYTNKLYLDPDGTLYVLYLGENAGWVTEIDTTTNSVSKKHSILENSTFMM